MLSSREVGQIATAMAHAAKANIDGMPLITLVSAFEILASHAEEPVSFKFESGRITWAFGKDAKALTSR